MIPKDKLLHITSSNSHPKLNPIDQPLDQRKPKMNCIDRPKFPERRVPEMNYFTTVTLL